MYALYDIALSCCIWKSLAARPRMMHACAGWLVCAIPLENDFHGPEQDDDVIEK